MIFVLLGIKNTLKTQELNSYSSCFLFAFHANAVPCHGSDIIHSWFDLGGGLRAALLGQNKRRRIDEIDDR